MNPTPRRTGFRGARPAAFTLIELLAVLAVVAILAGILLPALGAARRSALGAAARVQLNRWTAAMEQFRLEYGYYPAVGTDGMLATAGDAVTFVRTLAGRNPDGSLVADAAELNGNVRRLAFTAFSAADFFDPDHPGAVPDFDGNELLCDSFGNTEIGVLVDRNGDGLIRASDDGEPVAVRGAAGEAALVPAEADLPAGGVRGGVLFYTAGSAAIPEDMVLSWK